jgi:Spy/CpxP family protein refolding chaperone
MKSKFLIATFAVLLLGLPLLAQMPPGPQGPGGPPMPGPGPSFHRGPELGQWWKNSEIVNQLHLTDAQIKQIEDRFLQHRLALIDANAAVQKGEAKLEALMNADPFNEQKTTAQIDELVAARGRLEKEFAMMLLDVRLALTPEQWTKLQAIRQQRRMHGPERMRLPHREGMPGRPEQLPNPPADM